MRNPEFSENCRANRRERHNRVYLMGPFVPFGHREKQCSKHSVLKAKERREREHLVELIDERKGEKETKETFLLQNCLLFSIRDL